MPSSSLVKLKILGFTDPTCTGTESDSIVAFINPSAYKRSLTVEYNPDNPIGSSASTQGFKSIGQSDLSLSFFVDGTGVVKLPAGFTDVDAYIAKFTDLVSGYQGDIHRPYYLLIIWGALKFTGVCSKIEVKYSLFNPDGKALRATIDIDLSQSKDYKTKTQESANTSPDLTHLRTVTAGDTLPLMAYRIYGDSSHYLKVARANGLSSFQDVKPGDQIYFPPIKK
jgi:nucleoid-associated protein YgaU